jgi:hypothetical protein
MVGSTTGLETSAGHLRATGAARRHPQRSRCGRGLSEAISRWAMQGWLVAPRASRLSQSMVRDTWSVSALVLLVNAPHLLCNGCRTTSPRKRWVLCSGGCPGRVSRSDGRYPRNTLFRQRFPFLPFQLKTRKLRKCNARTLIPFHSQTDLSVLC